MLKFLFFQETKSWEFRFPTKSTIPRALIYKTVYKINNIKKKENSSVKLKMLEVPAMPTNMDHL